MTTETALEAGLRQFIMAGTGLDADHVIWSDGKPRPIGPYVQIEIPDFDAKDYDWLDVERNVLALPAQSATLVDATANTLTIPAHKFKTGDGALRASTSGVLPGALAPAVNYFAIALDADHVQLATTFLRAMNTQPIDLLDAGTGTLTLTTTPTTVRQGSEINLISRGVRRLEAQLQCYSPDTVGPTTSRALLQALLESQRLPSQSARLRAVKLGLTGYSSIQTITGVQNSTVFEARSVINLIFYTVSEIRETATIIERTTMTDTARARTVRTPRNDG